MYEHVCYLHWNRPGTPRLTSSWKYHNATQQWERVGEPRVYLMCLDCIARWDALDRQAEAGEPWTGPVIELPEDPMS